MNRLSKSCTLAALLLVALASARADVPKPRDDGHKPAKDAQITTSMHIQTNYKATEARLLIPRAVWQQMRAELDGTSAPVAGSRFSALGGAQTVMAGIFLSLAFAFGGVWLVRGHKGTSKLTQAALGVAFVALSVGATAGLVYANAGPPPIARSLTSQILAPGAQPYGVYGQVKVEFTDADYNQIVLELPRGKENKDGEE